MVSVLQAAVSSLDKRIRNLRNWYVNRKMGWASVNVLLKKKLNKGILCYQTMYTSGTKKIKLQVKYLSKRNIFCLLSS